MCITLHAQVNQESIEILHAIKAIEKLDIACARAQHAQWLSAVRPHFSVAGTEVGTGCGMRLDGAQHPLLLEMALPALPEPPSVRPCQSLSG